MPDYLAYWPNFKSDAARGSWPTLSWFTNHALFQNLTRGDHLWLVIAGESFNHPRADRGFLAQELVVDTVVHNFSDNPHYPPAEFKFIIHALPSRTRIFNPPVDVDHIVRINAATRHNHIGTVLQAPKKLTDTAARPFYQLLTTPR